jgi:hypothetical protein
MVSNIINYMTLHWPAISALVGGSAGLSVALQYVLHKLHVDSKKVAFTLLHAFAVAGALASYYLANESVLPTYAGLALVAQVWHRFAVSPIYNAKIVPYLTFLSENSNTGQPQSAQLAAPVASQAEAPGFVS